MTVELHCGQKCILPVQTWVWITYYYDVYRRMHDS